MDNYTQLPDSEAAMLFSYFLKHSRMPFIISLTPVGAVFLSACVSRRLQIVDKPTHSKNADKLPDTKLKSDK